MQVHLRNRLLFYFLLIFTHGANISRFFLNLCPKIAELLYCRKALFHGSAVALSRAGTWVDNTYRQLQSHYVVVLESNHTGRTATAIEQMLGSSHQQEK